MKANRWLSCPEQVHWAMLAPRAVLAPLTSMHLPLFTACSSYCPLPRLTAFQRWLEWPLNVHWSMFPPFSRLAPKTSRHWPLFMAVIS